VTRPGPLLGSLVLHGLLVGVVLFPWPKAERPPVLNAVPVTIVSDEITVAAAPADNPQPEPVLDDAATAPPPPEPEPEPPTPAPTPPPLRPQPRPTPAPTPPPKKTETPPRPTPPRPEQPRPQPRREEPSLDLDALAGPRRPGPNTGTRAPTGQQGAGVASQAIGRSDLQALARQITPHWVLNCDLPVAAELEIRVYVRLSEQGRVVGVPRLDRPRTDATWRAAADGVLRAIQAAAPFDMPEGYEAQEIPFIFRTATQCAGR